jgi:DNA-directed RNA polymerase subunit alpha
MKDLAKLRSLILDENTATEFYGRFTAEPFERGYGHTIGNSLRRILISSLPGAAITAVKITGALHEFAVLKGVKEDVAHIILNLKKVRVKIISETPEKIYLRVSRQGQVTAADIEKNPNVEIMNPEQEIANIDSGVVLEMEIEVSHGKGYMLADETKLSQYPIGTILLDSLFSPVIKVNYEVENTRVEQSLNYDRLIIEIWTDGSINPQNALRDSAIILKQSVAVFIGEETDEDNEIVEENIEDANDQNISQLQTPQQLITSLNLSTRALNALRKAKIKTIKDLTEVTEEEMSGYKNFGERSIEEIKEKLSDLGLSLAQSKE